MYLQRTILNKQFANLIKRGAVQNMGRSMSVASNFHRQFEEAYAKKMEL